jgi:hypothetical protein
MEHKIQSAVSHVSGTVIAIVPLLVAAGFGTAAADSYLQERFSSRIADLILCGAYVGVALVIYIAVRTREQRSAEIAEAEMARMPIVSPVQAAMDQFHIPDIPQTLLGFAGKSGSAAAKAVLDQAPKNIHLLIGAGVGIFVASHIVDALNRRHGGRR